MSLIEAVGAGAGAGASAVALLGAGTALLQRRRVRQQRQTLQRIVHRLLKLDLFVSMGAVRLDTRLEEGVAWVGYDLWPERLTGGLNFLSGVRDEVERIGAELRAIDEADTSVARLRDDAEELCSLLRSAAIRYIDGTVDTYQAHEGKAQPVSAGGREITPTLRDTDLDQHRADRDRVTWLFRSCLHRIDPNIAEKYDCQWPIRRRDREVNRGLVHGPIVLPMDWMEDLDALD